MGDMDMSPTHKMAGITAASQLRPFSPPEREEYSVFTAAAGVSQERTLVWLLYQSGDRLCCVRLCCGRCQERTNVPAVPTAPLISFHPLSSRLAYPRFSEQCKEYKQRDNWHQEQNEQRYKSPN